MIPRLGERQAINLRALFDGLLVYFAPSARSRGLTFEASTLMDELTTETSVLRRFLVNLIDHAIRSASRGTTVTLVVSPQRGYAEFRVEYEGPRLGRGKPPMVLATGATSLQEPGFELTYCRLAVEAQGGSFWIGEGETGVVICATLPEAGVAGRPGRVRAKSGIQLRDWVPDATPKTVLLVDDEPLLRGFVSRILKDKGYGVIEADCAERAMDRLMVRQQPLALLLSDICLPGVSGADLVRQAKLLTPTLPTLLMSGTPKQVLVREGVIRQGTDLLQKPFSIAELVTKLDELAPLPSTATVGAR